MWAAASPDPKGGGFNMEARSAPIIPKKMEDGIALASVAKLANSVPS